MKLIFLNILFFISAVGFCQVQETIAPDYIKSVIFKGETDLGGIPIIQLGEKLTLEFDDIIGDEANYYYRINHYNFDWTPTVLAESEYLYGFDNIRIFNYENSFNTLQLFSHYRLSIPNEDTQGLRVSGNYMLSIYDDQQNLVFSRKFIVYEPLAQVPVAIKRSRDVSNINSKQVVQFAVESPNLLLKNPEETVKVLVLQNYILSSGITGLKPQYTIGNDLIYRYNNESSFWGGNEYLNFDSKDLRAANMNIRFIELKDLYHHYLYTDIVRAFRPYTYNPDINGDFVIRTMQGNNNDIEAEYVWMHFSLENYEALEGGELHLFGNFNNFNITDNTKLHYNKETGLYENAMLLKQGFYNYRYVLVNPRGQIVPGFISGNFAVTENQYAVVVYYRDIGGRFDRVIGVGTGNSINISN